VFPVIHSVSGTDVDAQFPNAFLQVCVVSEIVGQQPIDPSEDRHSSFQVFQSVEPRVKRIGSCERQVMANLHIGLFA